MFFFNFKIVEIFLSHFTAYIIIQKKDQERRSKKYKVTFLIILIFQVFFSRFKFLSFGSLGWSTRLLLYTPTDPGSLGWSKKVTLHFLFLFLWSIDSNYPQKRCLKKLGLNHIYYVGVHDKVESCWRPSGCYSRGPWWWTSRLESPCTYRFVLKNL